jgi:non-heme chloroperoxidase
MRTAILGAIFALACSSAWAATVTGTWQGTAGWRIVVKLRQAPDSSLSGGLYNVAANKDSGVLPVSGHVSGKTVEFSTWSDTYQGTLSVDGASLTVAPAGAPASHPLVLTRATKRTAWVIDPNPHAIRMIPVAQGVTLEVVDWGGTGTPLLLLAGNYNTAHVFDSLALHFTGRHHVYGITRRGFGISSAPAPTRENYDSDRLGDDVVAVMDALHIDKAFLAGHSIGGVELSAIGTRHPERALGLIYLEAGYGPALYEPKSATSIDVEAGELAYDFARYSAAGKTEKTALLKDIQQLLPHVQEHLPWAVAELADEQEWPTIPSQQARIGESVAASLHTYTGVKPPMLLIYAKPPACPVNCTPTSYQANFPAQIAAVQTDYPNARVVQLPNATHYVFRSNEADVEREMNVFMDGLH